MNKLNNYLKLYAKSTFFCLGVSFIAICCGEEEKPETDVNKNTQTNAGLSTGTPKKFVSQGSGDSNISYKDAKKEDLTYGGKQTFENYKEEFFKHIQKEIKNNNNQKKIVFDKEVTGEDGHKYNIQFTYKMEDGKPVIDIDSKHDSRTKEDIDREKLNKSLSNCSEGECTSAPDNTSVKQGNVTEVPDFNKVQFRISKSRTIEDNNASHASDKEGSDYKSSGNSEGSKSTGKSSSNSVSSKAC